MIEHARRMPHAAREHAERRNCSAQSHPLQSADLDPLDGKSRLRHQRRFQPALGADEADAMTAPRELARHRQRRNHVSPGAAAGHYEACFHPSCSLTLSNIPSDASVLSSELPPKLIIGSGKPLVGTMSSTTLILSKACTTIETVTPSARYFPKSSRASMNRRTPRHRITTNPASTAVEPHNPSSSPTVA